MSGSVNQRKDTGAYYVQWYDKKSMKTVKLYRYNGEKMFHKKTANKLLAQMQGAVENGTYVLERYSKRGWTDTVPFIEEWIPIHSDEILSSVASYPKLVKICAFFFNICLIDFFVIFL